MLALRRRWAGLSILNKAIVLSCTFVIPILLVVGLLLNDFYAYRKESDRILSEYVLCTDYMDAVENEMSLLGEMTFAAPGSVELEDYADAVQNTSLVWERLRTTASAGGRDGEVLRQVIGRMMKSYRARQKIFLTGLRGGTFDADEYEQLRAQGEYLTQYTDRLMDDFLMEGRDSYLNLGKRSSSQNIVFTIAAARGALRRANTTWAIFIMHERTRSACWRIRSTISSIRSRGPSMRSRARRSWKNRSAIRRARRRVCAS